MGEEFPDASAITPTAAPGPAAPSPLVIRTAATRADLAATLRGIAAVAALSAGNLETHGSLDALGAHFGTLGELFGQFYERGTTFEALVTSAGSA